MERGAYRYGRFNETVYARIEEGQELPGILVDLLRGIGGGYSAVVHAIGGLESLEIGVFRGDGYDVAEIKPFPGHVLEVVGLHGSIIFRGGDYSPHLHIVVARSHGEVYAGHLVRGRVKPFLEVFLTLFRGEPGELRRVFPHRFP